MRTDALLWSINDRLDGGNGLDIAPLTDDWLSELCWLNQDEAEEAQRRDEARMDADDLE